MVQSVDEVDVSAFHIDMWMPTNPKGPCKCTPQNRVWGLGRVYCIYLGPKVVIWEPLWALSIYFIATWIVGEAMPEAATMAGMAASCNLRRELCRFGRGCSQSVVTVSMH